MVEQNITRNQTDLVNVNSGTRRTEAPITLYYTNVVLFTTKPHKYIDKLAKVCYNGLINKRKESK